MRGVRRLLLRGFEGGDKGLNVLVSCVYGILPVFIAIAPTFLTLAVFESACAFSSS